MKKIISLAMVLVLLLSFGSSTFAISNNEEDITVINLDSTKVLVKDSEGLSLIKIEGSYFETKITVNNLSTGDSSYFIRNNIANTLYSSITGYTGSLEDTNSNIYSRSGEITNYISYKTLANYVGFGAGAATLLAGIVGLLGGPAVMGHILTIISGALAMINSGMASGLENSGLKVTMEEREVTRRKGSQGEFTYIELVITNISFY